LVYERKIGATDFILLISGSAVDSSFKKDEKVDFLNLHFEVILHSQS
jgi:hypothetical protein